MDLNKILVPTDFSDASSKAFQQAVWLARGGGVEILVLHRLASALPVFPPQAQPGGMGYREIGRFLDDYLEELRRDAEKELDALLKSAPEDGASVTTSITDELEPHEAILHHVEEWGADLVAMGTHGRRGFDKLLTGSVTAKVLHHTDAHVMLIRADSELYRGEGRILVPVDFSDHSHRALGLARQLVSRRGGFLHLVHVVELLQTPFRPGGLSSRFEDEPELRAKYEEALRDMLGTSEGEVTVAEGSIAGAILQVRENAEAGLVVMGSRGLTGLPHLLLGSVAEKVSRFCEVPVVIVK